jgi:hypothetical protein
MADPIVNEKPTFILRHQEYCDGERFDGCGHSVIRIDERGYEHPVHLSWGHPDDILIDRWAARVISKEVGASSFTIDLDRSSITNECYG